MNTVDIYVQGYNQEELDNVAAIVEEGIDFSGANGDWDNAIGASAMLIGCNNSCLAKHLFSKTKRNACKAACTQRYQVRQETGQVFGTRKALEGGYVVGQGGGVPTPQPQPLPQPQPQPTPQPQQEVGLGMPTQQLRSMEEGEGNAQQGGLGTGAMVGIGVGVVAILVIGGILIAKK